LELPSAAPSSVQVIKHFWT